MIRRLSAISAIGTIVFMSCAGIAGAYSITGSGAPNSTPSAGVSLQPLPSGTFSPDWGSFLKNLPVQPFLESLQSVGGAAVQSVQSGRPALPSASTVNGQGIVNQIDDWTQKNFGFQLSAILSVFLNLLAWVLGLAKNIVDWLLGLVNGK